MLTTDVLCYADNESNVNYEVPTKKYVESIIKNGGGGGGSISSDGDVYIAGDLTVDGTISSPEFNDLKDLFNNLEIIDKPNGGISWGGSGGISTNGDVHIEGNLSVDGTITSPFYEIVDASNIGITQTGDDTLITGDLTVLGDLNAPVIDEIQSKLDFEIVDSPGSVHINGGSISTNGDVNIDGNLNVNGDITSPMYEIVDNPNEGVSWNDIITSDGDAHVKGDLSVDGIVSSQNIDVITSALNSIQIVDDVRTDIKDYTVYDDSALKSDIADIQTALTKYEIVDDIRTDIKDYTVYDDTDIRNELDTKADIGHKHTIADITGFDQYDDSNLIAAVATKADINHTHTKIDNDLNVNGDLTATGDVSGVNINNIQTVINSFEIIDDILTDVKDYTVYDDSTVRAEIAALNANKAENGHTHTMDEITDLVLPEDVVTATTTDRIPEDLISTDIARATHTHSEFKNNLKITGNLTVSGNVVHNNTNLFDSSNTISSSLIPSDVPKLDENKDLSIEGNLTLGTEKTLTIGTKSLSSIIVDLVYPVGSIYISTDSESPATLFSGTTWEQIIDRFLYCTTSGGETGGSKTITVENLPAHSHKIAKDKMYRAEHIDGTSGSGSDCTYWKGAAESWYNNNNKTEETGSGTDYMPPYYTVYAWKRTA